MLAGIGKFALSLLGITSGSGERDPQFAEETVDPTMPPDLFSEGEDIAHEDNSASWDTSVQTPVEKTASELEQEARDSQN